MRFEPQKNRSVRNYTSRREQLRLLLLFVPLALVIILMSRLRDPKTAGAINTFFTPDAESAPISKSVASDLAPAPVTNQRQAPQAIPGIRSELLDTIEDNTYFRTAEKDAWFHFIELLQKAAIDSGQAVNVEYAQLVDQPEVYRGKLVTVSGTARQITQEKPAANDLGVTSYYRVVIQPADGANWPIIVYCLELPQGISPGDDLSIAVNATGLFFKKLSYKWRDGLGIAPVIVARSLAPATIALAANDDEASLAEAVAATDVMEPFHETTLSGVKQSEDYDQWLENKKQTDEAAFDKILALSGWDKDRLAKLDDGQPLSETQRLESLELLRRLRSIGSATLNDWRQYLPLQYELKNPDELRGMLRCLVGRVTKVTPHKLDAESAARLEMPEYFECEMECNNLKGLATVLTTRVPKEWLQGHLQGAAAANVLYLKQLPGEKPPRSLWLAKEIAWYPGAPGKVTDIDDLFRDSKDPLLGKSMLGTGSMDVGLLDLVESRGRIRPQERDAFYSVLHAVGQIPVSTLVRIAKDNLPVVEEHWEKQLQAKAPARQKLLAREVVQLAEKGRYSVALLFNDPAPQIGRLFVFDGVARRAVRVEVSGATEDGLSNGIADRFGFDHYYELEVFTEDSQNYPLIFCVRELPEGFPVGPDIHQPVRMAGFFFKNWLYTTRGGPMADAGPEEQKEGSRAQFAPLLIGPTPIMLSTAPPTSNFGRFVLGGLFVLGLLGIVIAAVWLARDERRFRQRTPAAGFALPTGQSLNDLNLSAVEVPMITTVDLEPPPAEPAR